MAGIKDLLSLFDDKLKDIYHKVSYSPDADRARMVKRLESTKQRFLATEPQRGGGKKDFSIANNVVAWTPPTPNGSTLFEAGTVYVPGERYVEAIDKTIELIRAGEFDARLEGDQNASAPKAPRATRQPRPPREPGSGGKGWSPERHAKFAATVAARKAAKQ